MKVHTTTKAKRSNYLSKTYTRPKLSVIEMSDTRNLRTWLTSENWIQIAGGCFCGKFSGLWQVYVFNCRVLDCGWNDTTKREWGKQETLIVLKKRQKNKQALVLFSGENSQVTNDRACLDVAGFNNTFSTPFFNCAGIKRNTHSQKKNTFHECEVSKVKTGLKLKIAKKDDLKELFRDVNGILKYWIGILNHGLLFLCTKYLRCKVNKALLSESSKSTRSYHFDEDLDSWNFVTKQLKRDVSCCRKLPP